MSFISQLTLKVGLRPTQEDRMILVPKLFSEEVSVCGVFDGTVGHHASEFIMNNFTHVLCNTKEVQELLQSLTEDKINMSAKQKQHKALLIRNALRKTFLNVDEALIRMCHENHYHYASSTGVTAIVWNNLLTVAHVGDSKACIAKVSESGDIFPEWLTIDHKPNMPQELRRIQECGGSLAWLHGNKPYIRGGDFLRRQANGEHPKQLNYSRAFGGKDLKMFGLSVEPDINHFEINHDDKLVLIASDGLWDVINPKLACEIAILAHKNGRSATQDIVETAVRNMPSCGVCDNVTVIAIFLNESSTDVP